MLYREIIAVCSQIHTKHIKTQSVPHSKHTPLSYKNQPVNAEIATHNVTKHNTPIHNILSTVSQLSISQKALGTLPEDGNVMPKHAEATIHN